MDLPQHALFLQRMLDGSNDVYHVRWSVPYVLLFAIARPVALLSDAAQGIWVATAFAIALLPVGAAALSHSLRRSPALGLFAYLAAFSTVVAWGFSSLVLSGGLFALSVAAAVRYARGPTALRGALLALMLLVTYFGHIVGWTLAVSACLAIIPVWSRRFRPSYYWPLALGVTISLAFLAVSLIDRVHPWAEDMPALIGQGEDHGLVQRLEHLPLAFTEYGRRGAALPYWLPVALCFLIGVGISLRDALLLIKRARRSGVRVSSSDAERLRRLLKRYGMQLALLVSAIAYFVVPLWVGKVLLAYPRILIFAAVLTPAAFVGPRRRVLHWLALAAVIPILLLVRAEFLESRAFAEHTRCIDVLGRAVRQGESLLSINYGPTSGDYSVPVDLHLAAELAARRRAMIGKDFSDYGAGPVAYQPGVDRLIVPTNLFWNPLLYSHARHGREFTAWLLIAPPGDLRALTATVFGAAQGLRVQSCGPYALVTDESVRPGGRPHDTFLPHRHEDGGGCSPEKHPEVFGPRTP